MTRLSNDNYFHVVKSNGNSAWYLNGELHRDKDDEPAVTSPDGTYKAWYKFGKIHRENGPAIINTTPTNSMYAWFIDNQRHRYDGPALILIKNGFEQNKEAWFLFGNLVSAMDYKSWLIVNGISLYRMTEYDKMLIKMKWE